MGTLSASFSETSYCFLAQQNIAFHLAGDPRLKTPVGGEKTQPDIALGAGAHQRRAGALLV